MGRWPRRKGPEARTVPAGQQAEVAPERGLERSFGVLALLGVVLVGAAVFGLLYTAFVTLTGVLLFGWLLLIGGVVGLVHAVVARRENFFWLGTAVAALNIAAGVVMVVRPEAAAAGLTLFAALLFLSAGSYRLVGGLVVRGAQFGWTVLLGVLDLLIGILVLANWPSSSLYTLGLFFSLSLLFDGLMLISTGVGARRVIGMVGEARRATEEAVPQPVEGAQPAGGPEPVEGPQPHGAGGAGVEKPAAP